MRRTAPGPDADGDSRGERRTVPDALANGAGAATRTEAVWLAEQSFRETADGLPLLCWMAQPDGHIFWYNRQWYEFTGTAPADMEGWGWRSVHDPETLPEVERRWRASLEAGVTFEMVFPLRSADGRFVPHLTRANPIKDPRTGRIVRWFGTNTEVLGIVEASVELERQVAARERMWLLSTDLMVIVRFDGTFAAINPAFTEALGWTEEDLAAGSITNADLSHPEDLEGLRGEMANLVAGFTTHRFEFRLRAKDDGYRWFSWAAVPYEGVIHAVGRDVTAEKESVAALKRAEISLRQAHKMEAIGLLAGGVAHDFNNCAAAALAGLALFEKKHGRLVEAEPHALMLLDGVRRAAKRGGDTAHRLLAFARRDTLKTEPVYAAEALDELAASPLVSTMLGTGIKTRVVRPDPEEMGPFLADRAQLAAALLNLMINARDAMTPEGGDLTLSAMQERISDNQVPGLFAGEYIKLQVGDTGRGMDAETMRRCCEPFFTTKPPGDGTGLGLSSALGFAEQSGGSLRIDSEPGRGTTVSIWLPLAPEEQPGRKSEG